MIPKCAGLFRQLLDGHKKQLKRLQKKCQEWDLNPRPFGPVPETGALDQLGHLDALFTSTKLKFIWQTSSQTHECHNRFHLFSVIWFGEVAHRMQNCIRNLANP